jgi:glycosyltransferase involved in cell wall biosynthesis
MLIAKIKGIKVRIAHCHNTTCDNKKVHKILQPLFRKIYTHGFACSVDAGKWMFNNSNFEVLPNGFITEKFIFDEKKRKEVRKKLNIDDKYVIGHVGMFLEQKNHEFILQVFEEVAKAKEDSVLLLIGTGPDYDKIQKIIEEHHYKDRIICYGVTNNVSELYDAMDLFFFPSKHEGLGIVLLEAQIKGLKCVTSDVVPREVVLDDNNIKFISLDDDIAVWKNELISNDIKGTRKSFYKKQIEKINRFNIIENAKDLGDKYILYCKKNK